MINVIFNNKVVACPNSQMTIEKVVPIDPYKCFSTEYGMFITTSTSGHLFIRWIRNGMKDKLPPRAIASSFLHIANDGEISFVTADSENNNISSIPYCIETFSIICRDREHTEAYTLMLKDCKTIAEAVRIIEDKNFIGLFQPIIVTAEEWVKYAKEKGYNKTFYRSTFDVEKSNIQK